MAFFKFRTAPEGATAPRQPESIEAMRRRARHRLIGATVLVLVGVVGFPLLFDTQPRPIPVDIPIEIPDRNKAKPLPVPRAAAPAPVASGKVGTPPAAAPAPAVAAAPAPAKVEVAPAAKPDPGKPEVTAKAEATAPAKPAETKPAEPSKPPAKTEAARDDGNRAQALLEGKPAKEAAAVEGRFVVQVGAFADVTKAREARQRLERAGLKTYTNVAETSNGRRIRVRVGPFPTRAEADKAARKIKGLDMPAAILTL